MERNRSVAVYGGVMTSTSTDPLPIYSAMLRTALQDQLAPDAMTFLEMLAPDATMEFPYALEGGVARLEGREAIAHYVAGLGFDIHSISAPRVHRAGDGVVVLEFEGVGRHILNGQDYTMTYISVITLRDGHIVFYRDYWNPLVVLDAMGATISMPEVQQ